MREKGSEYYQQTMPCLYGCFVYYRCVKFRGRSTRLLPTSCNEFYDSKDSIFNGSRIRGIKLALDNTFDALNVGSADGSECMKSVQQYFCYYYFPLCKFTAGELIPVCDNSCNMLFNNNDCSNLLMHASRELMRHRRGIPLPDTSCSRTNRRFNPHPSVSVNCTVIKGELIASL